MTVWGALEEAILNPSLIMEQAARLKEKVTADVNNFKATLAELQTALERLQREEDRLLEAYRSGNLPASLLGRELEKLNGKRVSMEESKVNPSQQAAKVVLPDIRQSITEYCEAVSRRMKSFDPDERQRFTRHIVNEVVFQGDAAIIRGVLPVCRLPEDWNIPSLASDENVSARSLNIPDRIAVFPKHDFAVPASYPYDHNSVLRNDQSRNTEAHLFYGNSVFPVPFDLARALPKGPVSITKRLDYEALRKLVEREPSAPLQHLCQHIKTEQGIALSTTSMWRALKRIKLPESYTIRGN